MNRLTRLALGAAALTALAGSAPAGLAPGSPLGEFLRQARGQRHANPAAFELLDSFGERLSRVPEGEVPIEVRVQALYLYGVPLVGARTRIEAPRDLLAATQDALAKLPVAPGEGALSLARRALLVTGEVGLVPLLERILPPLDQLRPEQPGGPERLWEAFTQGGTLLVGRQPRAWARLGALPVIPQPDRVLSCYQNWLAIRQRLEADVDLYEQALFPGGSKGSSPSKLRVWLDRLQPLEPAPGGWMRSP